MKSDRKCLIYNIYPACIIYTPRVYGGDHSNMVAKIYYITYTVTCIFIFHIKCISNGVFYVFPRNFAKIKIMFYLCRTDYHRCCSRIHRYRWKQYLKALPTKTLHDFVVKIGNTKWNLNAIFNDITRSVNSYSCHNSSKTIDEKFYFHDFNIVP